MPNLGEQYAAALAAAERQALRRHEPSPMEMLDAAYECAHGLIRCPDCHPTQPRPYEQLALPVLAMAA